MPEPQDASTGAQAQGSAQDPLANLPVPPPIPGGRELYDSIMAQIEPELTTAGIATLDGLYVDETPEQKAERARRYEAAFAEYAKRFEQYNTEWLSQFSTFQRKALQSVETLERDAEEESNEQLYQRIQQFS